MGQKQNTEKRERQAGFAEPHSSSTIGWVGLGLGWVSNSDNTHTHTTHSQHTHITHRTHNTHFNLGGRVVGWVGGWVGGWVVGWVG